ncbi:hypothetical protein [Microseira wollei]|uniref:Transposase n=1 Tax=Microseira wollei NIES-4236 TaxID=2530354 RepID=A0AAV3XE48_9CYAN|nr:hypothetical protein [Microseira wollei]GET39105.1 hypothetical protein MiSe_38680 [Microseira wollei NIES-4236]
MKNRWERQPEIKVETGFLATPLRKSCASYIWVVLYTLPQTGYSEPSDALFPIYMRLKDT